MSSKEIDAMAAAFRDQSAEMATTVGVFEGMLKYALPHRILLALGLGIEQLAVVERVCQEAAAEVPAIAARALTNAREREGAEAKK